MKSPLYIISILILSILLFFLGVFISNVSTEKPSLIPEKPVTIEERPTLALGAATVAQFFVNCGIQGADHALVRDLLLEETPQEIDLSTAKPEDIIADHLQCLTDTEIKQGILNKKNIKQMLIDKAVTGVAGKKPIKNYTNP